MPTLSTHEAGFVDHFIAASRRDRWRMLLRGKRRRTLLDRIASPEDFDRACLVPVATSDQSAARVFQLLQQHGAPENCYLISRDPAFDGMTRPLEGALEDLVGQCDPVVVSCIPGRLGYFEDESGYRFLLLSDVPKKR